MRWGGDGLGSSGVRTGRHRRSAWHDAASPRRFGSGRQRAGCGRTPPEGARVEECQADESTPIVMAWRNMGRPAECRSGRNVFVLSGTRDVVVAFRLDGWLRGVPCAGEQSAVVEWRHGNCNRRSVPSDFGAEHPWRQHHPALPRWLVDAEHTIQEGTALLVLTPLAGGMPLPHD